MSDENIRKFTDYAYRLLAARDLFSGDLARRLRDKGASEEETEIVVNKLRDLNYLDDERLLRNFAREVVSRGKGINYLRQKLYEKGCADLLKSVDLSEFFSYEDELKSAAETIKKLAENDPQKLQRKLASRGFSYSAISAAMGKIRNKND
ncbi:RecX family transcriptional regulator [bacterium]|nr:RecX family transcriptional regulator [bacterium]